jgi:hypothetical protein
MAFGLDASGGAQRRRAGVAGAGALSRVKMTMR